MKEVNYTKEGVHVDASLDGVVVRKHIAGFAGGRALDMDGYTAKVVPCGLPIATNGSGDFKPIMPTAGTDSVSFTLPSGYTYAGICGSSILAGKAASVVNAGVINEPAMFASIAKAFPTIITDTEKVSISALKTALPHLIFEKDEVGDAPTTTTEAETSFATE